MVPGLMSQKNFIHKNYQTTSSRGTMTMSFFCSCLSLTILKITGLGSKSITRGQKILNIQQSLPIILFIKFMQNTNEMQV